MMRQALREAAVLFFFAAALGSIYTASTGKGLFADTAGISSPLSGDHAPVLIPLDEAREFFDSGEALFIDARHEFDYKLGHIKGAMNIPLQELDERTELISAIAKDKLLIIYCDGAECNSSIELSSKLFQSGYSNIRIFFGGWREWEAAGLPIAQSQD